MTNFYLLRPQDLPQTYGELLAPAGSAPGAALATATALSPTSSDQETLAGVVRALRQVPMRPHVFTVVIDDPAESAGNRDNDKAFGIVRVRGDVRHVLAHSTLYGYSALLEEALAAGTNLDAREWGRLRSAFAQLLAFMAGAPIPQAAEHIPVSSADSAGDRDALRRWTRGHHVFMVILQGLVVALNCFRAHLDVGAQTEAQRDMRLATSLMWGAQAALRFTGDFTYSEYEKRVRPTLMPPIAPPGMTGLRWRDHEYLVAVLGQLRPVFSDSDPWLAAERDQFHAALAATYDSHKHVCASFVGTELPSLLMTSRSKKSAVSVLEHFKRVRLNLVKD